MRALPRTVKDPEVRREELLDVAEDLFSERGYDETTVSDIVGAAGIAQGTFYHYFRSKEELLEAMAERLTEDIVVILEEVVDDETLPAVDKLPLLFLRIRDLSSDRRSIVQYLHEERHVHLHFKLERRMYAIWTPLIRSVILQGVQEGSFETRYPEEAAIAILSFTAALSHGEDRAVLRQRRRRTVEAFFDLVERILGARPGTLTESIGRMGST